MRRIHAIAGFSLLMGTAAALAAWAALTPLEGLSNEQVYVIPQGTWARRMKGENLAILPDELRLTLGVKDVLVLENHDDVPQIFGPVLIMPGQTFRMPFHRVATYQFACSLHVSGQLSVIVSPAPEPGWDRLKWRATSIGSPGAWLRRIGLVA
jgi:hypothetical protein